MVETVRRILQKARDGLFVLLFEWPFQSAGKRYMPGVPKEGDGVLTNKFPERLRELRGRVSQTTLSQLCGLGNDDAIRRYERGDARPGMDSLAAIADYFVVSMDYLCGRTDKKEINR